MNLMLNPSRPQATVYTKLGQTLRVPLRSGASPERQLVGWLNRQTAANPGFPVRIKSLLLIVDQLPCLGCRGVLSSYLRRWHLTGRLRLLARQPASARCACVRAEAGASSYLPEVLGEAPAPPLQLGTYASIAGHHVHQSAAYTPPAGRGQRQPPSARANPNHGPAVTVRQGVPGFTAEQHQRASAVQNATNRAARRAGVDTTAGTVRVQSWGEGRALTPSPWLEDTKAYYALRGAGRTPADAYAAVRRSGRQLDATGTRPLRVPR